MSRIRGDDPFAAASVLIRLPNSLSAICLRMVSAWPAWLNGSPTVAATSTFEVTGHCQFPPTEDHRHWSTSEGFLEIRSSPETYQLNFFFIPTNYAGNNQAKGFIMAPRPVEYPVPCTGEDGRRAMSRCPPAGARY